MTIVVILIVLNLAISVVNAHVTGKTWDEVKASGSVWQKLILYSGWLQSALGGFRGAISS